MQYLIYSAIALGVSTAVVHVFPTQTVRGATRALTRVLGFHAKSQSVDGIRWPYLEGGQGDDVVLLVHGYAADKESWLAYALRLRGAYRIVIPDLPGFGANTRDATLDYSPRAQAARVIAFCEALGIDRCHVVGSSMGGYISCWMALDAPKLVATLTLMNAAGVLGERASVVQQEAEQGRNPLLADTMLALDRLLPLLSHRTMPLPGFVRKHLLAQYREHAEHLDRVFWQLVDAQQTDGVEENLTMVQMPTLVIWGEFDQIIDVSCAAVFTRLIPTSRLLILPAVGHIPMYEAPQAAATAHKALIRSAP